MLMGGHKKKICFGRTYQRWGETRYYVNDYVICRPCGDYGDCQKEVEGLRTDESKEFGSSN